MPAHCTDRSRAHHKQHIMDATKLDALRRKYSETKGGGEIFDPEFDYLWTKFTLDR